MFLLIGDLSGENQRTGGLLISLLFLLAGAGLMLISRDPRAANAGVGLSAVAVLPLLVHTFVDVRSPENTFGSTGDVTGTATAILLVAALIWLAAHLFGPAGHHGLLLGAALVALWLVGVVQVIDGAIDQVTPSVESNFVPIGEAVEDPWAEDLAEDPWADDGWATGDVAWDDSSYEPSNPITRLGVVSLLFGGGYLFLGAMGDRRGRARQATPLFAVATPILTLAVLFLTDTLEVEGASLLAMALGSVAAWVTVGSDRRATCWYGTAGASLGAVVFVTSTTSDDARVQAAVLLLIGILLAVAAMALGNGSEGSGEPIPPPPRTDPDHSGTPFPDATSTWPAPTWTPPPAHPPSEPAGPPPPAPGSVPPAAPRPDAWGPPAP